jgi:hypothetical protein
VLTARLIRALRRARIARSKEVLTALKNASYGFDSAKMRSEAGRDGIYVLDRDYVPANEMMRKLFDRFLDRDDGEARDLAAYLELPLSKLLPVRLVSHHMRLLGVLAVRGSRRARARGFRRHEVTRGSKARTRRVAKSSTSLRISDGAPESRIFELPCAQCRDRARESDPADGCGCARGIRDPGARGPTLALA